MKSENSNLWIGLGLGLLAGAAIGAYLALSEEKKAKFVSDVNEVVDKAKTTIKKTFDAGLERLDDVADKVSSATSAAVARMKGPQPQPEEV